MNNADLIVATLKAAGIRHGFGISKRNVLRSWKRCVKAASSSY